MPIKRHGEVPNVPQNKREREAAKQDEIRMKAVEGQDTQGLKAVIDGGRK